ncbi:MAG: hypothetical protein HXY46_12075 [Syntrophaceae bacterium]|nr:hypothetical protein [Syntrophaceae bacterium]
MRYSLEKWRELIPLYLNGRLSEEERRGFERALREHPELQSELIDYSEIKGIYPEIEKDLPPPSPDLYERILSKIRLEGERASTAWISDQKQRVVDFLRGIFSSPRLSWGIAAVQLAIIILLVIHNLGEDRTRTLSSEDLLRKEGVIINVLFDKESKEKEIREVLTKVGATIIRGPSPDGLYKIAVKDQQNISHVLEVLRKSEIVRFAERAY